MKDNRSIRVQNLHRILLSKYLPNEELDRVFNTTILRGSSEENELLQTYKSLGGEAQFPELKFSVPFLVFGRFCVLLDEDIHFNKYRLKTLRSSFYEKLNSFPLMKYRTYCRKYEVECLKAGTSNPAWTNPEAERHFGPSQQNGDLGLNGSAGWKLNAFKDFSTDLIARYRKIRLLRISVWDDFLFEKKLTKINDLLVNPGKAESASILNFVERKVVGLYADDF